MLPSPGGRVTLSSLTNQLVVTMNNDPNKTFTVPEMSTACDAERRRVYDIVNILETVGLLTLIDEQSPKQKSYALSLESFLSQCSDMRNSTQLTPTVIHSSAPVQSAPYSSQNVTILYDVSVAVSMPSMDDTRFSIGALSKYFLELLISTHDPVTLDEVAASIAPAMEQRRRITRRLCDIANVLCATGIISRCSRSGSKRKLAFEWSGDELTLDRLLQGELEEVDVPGRPDSTGSSPVGRIIFGSNYLMDRTLFGPG
ncbi:Transcription factor E2F-like [Carpediemonas membranifera]|uniref:Transcription factor E2F-like n=1 Tax=Carpediemonas membranifera TaxID=201153 RepID=A0A8J6B2S1_9EUKA|nr:Transcription factor E2F-like [Carpediemonas membranifera]|eukprot:KAG9391694.1 Transcription factor E2F-like [Carpediemonas membranifera]